MFVGKNCHCPLSCAFTPMWKALWPGLELLICTKGRAVTPFGLKQHMLESCVGKKDKSRYLHQLALLYLEALYRDAPNFHGATKNWHTHPGFFKSGTKAFNEAMQHYTPSNPLVGRYLESAEAQDLPPTTSSQAVSTGAIDPPISSEDPVPGHVVSNLKPPPPPPPPAELEETPTSSQLKNPKTPKPQNPFYFSKIDTRDGIKSKICVIPFCKDVCKLKRFYFGLLIN